MSHEEYLKTIKSELRRLNRIIDYKILNGEKYFKEAKEHKVLMNKIREHNGKGKGLFGKVFLSLARF